jgi:hypothetical protein
MFVCYECCVLSGRGLCDELITRQQESYRLWCVVVCDLENLKNEEAMTRVGSQRHKKKKASRVISHNIISKAINKSRKSTTLFEHPLYSLGSENFHFPKADNIF